MAVIKVFDSVGVKTLIISGNANDQPYDVFDDELEESAVEPTGEDEE